MALEPATHLKDRAEGDLRFIRAAMGRASTFTCVPGRGGIAMGVVGAVAAVLAPRAGSPRAWLAVWVAAGLLAFAIGVAAILRKARRAEHRPAGSAARRFTLSLLPPLVAGAGLTAALVPTNAYSLLPAIWLLLYGCAVVGAGVSSVPVVPLFGGALVALGLVALLLPAAGDLLLGFGAGQAACGLVVSRRHGG